MQALSSSVGVALGLFALFRGFMWIRLTLLHGDRIASDKVAANMATRHYKRTGEVVDPKVFAYEKDRDRYLNAGLPGLGGGTGDNHGSGGAAASAPSASSDGGRKYDDRNFNEPEPTGWGHQYALDHEAWERRKFMANTKGRF